MREGVKKKVQSDKNWWEKYSKKSNRRQENAMYCVGAWLKLFVADQFKFSRIMKQGKKIDKSAETIIL